MKLGGTGGANTRTGLDFEKKVDLIKAFENLPSYSLKIRPKKGKNRPSYDIYFRNLHVGIIFTYSDLFAFLKEKGNDQEQIWQKKLQPDKVFYNLLNETIYIIEVKYQDTEGSVDEKLQTCDFKRKKYVALLNGLSIDIEYIYVLSDWFKKDDYKEVLEYVAAEGCKFYFNEIPLNKLSLPYTDLEL